MSVDVGYNGLEPILSFDLDGVYFHVHCTKYVSINASIVYASVIRDGSVKTIDKPPMYLATPHSSTAVPEGFSLKPWCVDDFPHDIYMRAPFEPHRSQEPREFLDTFFYVNDIPTDKVYERVLFQASPKINTWYVILYSDNEKLVNLSNNT